MKRLLRPFYPHGHGACKNRKPRALAPFLHRLLTLFPPHPNTLTKGIFFQKTDLNPLRLRAILIGMLAMRKRVVASRTKASLRRIPPSPLLAVFFRRHCFKKNVDYDIDFNDINLNAASFEHSEIRNILSGAIQEALKKVRSDNIAGQKVDIVAHSMGGLVVRSFCAKEEAFCKEHIRKLITIDTPHLGSELADLLLIYRDQRDKFPSPPLCQTKVNVFIKGSKSLKVDPHPVDKGAVASLAVGKVPSGIEDGAESPLVGKWSGLSWPDSPTKVHRIVGDAKEYQNKGIRGLWDGLLNPCGFKRESVFFGHGGDDGIVGVVSQMGGGSSRPFFDEDHASVLGDEEVVKEIGKLLNE